MSQHLTKRCIQGLALSTYCNQFYSIFNLFSQNSSKFLHTQSKIYNRWALFSTQSKDHLAPPQICTEKMIFGSLLGSIVHRRRRTWNLFCNNLLLHSSACGKTIQYTNQAQHLQTPKLNTKSFHTSTIRFSEASLAWMNDGKTYRNGPDQILPTEAVYSWDARGATQINLRGSGRIANIQPISVPSLLKACADKSPATLAMRIKRDGLWQTWTYSEYLSDVRTAAKGFIALGLESYHSVCILGYNSPEWFIANIGTIFAGGFGAGIYTTSGPESCAYVAHDSLAHIYVVEDAEQLAKVLKIRDQLPHLKAIIQYTGEPTEPGVLSWAELMVLGNQQSDVKLEERLKQQAINQCCTLIYTSGTTGVPKGVMLSHDNLTWIAHAVQDWANYREATEAHQEVMVSYLPLSHVAAQITDIYGPLACSGVVTFADKDALKGTLIKHLKEASPTKFLAVPRVWEKLYESISEAGSRMVGIKRVLLTWAKTTGLKSNLKTSKRGTRSRDSLTLKLANELVYSKIHEALGLSHCDLNISGAAPISPDILKFFLGINIVIREAYGLSESTGPHTMTNSSFYRLGSVGKTIAGCMTEIEHPDKDGNGEILLGGRNICMGYLNKESKTMNAIDQDGWMHSGDVGRFDADGFLFITGRLKEILVTAGGENVAPVPIEDSIKRELPPIAEAVVIGDKRKFISAILALKTKVDNSTQHPLEKLTSACQRWMETNGDCQVSTVTQVLEELNEKKNLKLIQAFQDGINRCNEYAISHAQRIQKWVVLPVSFSIPGGELGPTLKLKRSVVLVKFKNIIDSMYDDTKAT